MNVKHCIGWFPGNKYSFTNKNRCIVWAKSERVLLISKRIPIVCFLLFSKAIVFGQMGISSDIHLGYASNTYGFFIAEREVRNVHALTGHVGSYIHIPLRGSYYIQTGLYANGVVSGGKVGNSQYRSTSMKAYLPVMGGRKITERIDLLAGVSARNNRDMKHFHIRNSHNFRFDMRFQMHYQLANNWKLSTTFRHDLGIPRPFLLNDPRISFSFGLIYDWILQGKKAISCCQ